MYEYFQADYYAINNATDIVLQFGQKQIRVHSMIVNKFLDTEIDCQFDDMDDELIDVFMHVLYQYKFKKTDLGNLILIQPLLMQIQYYGPIHIPLNFDKVMKLTNDYEPASLNNIVHLTTKVIDYHTKSRNGRFICFGDYIYDREDYDFQIKTVPHGSKCVALSDDGKIVLTNESGHVLICNPDMSVIQIVKQTKIICSVSFINNDAIVIYNPASGTYIDIGNEQPIKFAHNTTILPQKENGLLLAYNNPKITYFCIGTQRQPYFDWSHTQSCSDAKKLVCDWLGNKMYYVYRKDLVCYDLSTHTISTALPKSKHPVRIIGKYLILENGHVLDLLTSTLTHMNPSDLIYNEKIISACIPEPDWTMIGQVMKVNNMNTLLSRLDVKSRYMMKKILVGQPLDAALSSIFVKTLIKCCAFMDKWAIPIMPTLNNTGYAAIKDKRDLLKDNKSIIMFKCLYNTINKDYVHKVGSKEFVSDSWFAICIDHDDWCKSVMLARRPSDFDSSGGYVIYDWTNNKMFVMDNEHNVRLTVSVIGLKNIWWTDNRYEYTIYGDNETRIIE